MQRSRKARQVRGPDLAVLEERSVNAVRLRNNPFAGQGRNRQTEPVEMPRSVNRQGEDLEDLFHQLGIDFIQEMVRDRLKRFGPKLAGEI